jgi:hypothetical protein
LLLPLGAFAGAGLALAVLAFAGALVGLAFAALAGAFFALETVFFAADFLLTAFDFFFDALAGLAAFRVVIFFAGFLDFLAGFFVAFRPAALVFFAMGPILERLFDNGHCVAIVPSSKESCR